MSNYTVRRHVPYEHPEVDYFETIEAAKDFIKSQLQSSNNTYLYDFSLFETPEEIDIEDLRVFQKIKRT